MTPLQLVAFAELLLRVIDQGQRIFLAAPESYRQAHFERAERLEKIFDRLLDPLLDAIEKLTPTEKS
jgi:hypothetical protein